MDADEDEPLGRRGADQQTAAASSTAHHQSDSHPTEGGSENDPNEGHAATAVDLALDQSA